MKTPEHQPQLRDYFMTRRGFLNKFGMGFGALSLANLLGPAVGRAAESESISPLAPKKPHFAAKAKRVIHIFAQGGPSHLDTWDPKPALAQHAGKTVSAIGGAPLPSPFKFTKRGRSGLEVSELFPKIGDHIDDIAVIRSMHTDIPAHEFATVMMNTGSGRLVKPSMGSWVTYGLGTENQSLPAFIALAPGGNALGGSQNWRSAFLPGTFQGTMINTQNTSVDRLIENIRNPYSTSAQQQEQMDLLRQMNQLHSEQLQNEAPLEARIQSFELAFQMQTEATDAFDINKEPENIRSMYGTTPLGRQLLIARRLAESGVRFIQIWHGGWDHHTGIEQNLRRRASECDQPIAALLTDLRERGMLEDTLIVWGGEFGRTPRHGRGARGEPGRDHHNKAFSLWMAGGGVKGGQAYGATDEFGYETVENKVHIHDLHATILALLGFDHEKLTYRYNGRDFRLTDVYGNVVKALIA
ncbi:MAG: DUF1501 domain-containing protein [Verrucomicrobiales bacterium]